MKPVSTLKIYLMRPKDAILTKRQSGVIYSIPCKDCRTDFFGILVKTGRSPGTRKNEHKGSVSMANTKDSALAQHHYNNDHSIDWDNSKIIIISKENH